MNSNANAFCATCFAVLSAPVILLGFLEDAPVAGFVGALVCYLIAYAFFNRAEILLQDEARCHRLCKGRLA